MSGRLSFENLKAQKPIGTTRAGLLPSRNYFSSDGRVDAFKVGGGISTVNNVRQLIKHNRKVSAAEETNNSLASSIDGVIARQRADEVMTQVVATEVLRAREAAKRGLSGPAVSGMIGNDISQFGRTLQMGNSMFPTSGNWRIATLNNPAFREAVGAQYQPPPDLQNALVPEEVDVRRLREERNRSIQEQSSITAYIMGQAGQSRVGMRNAQADAEFVRPFFESTRPIEAQRPMEAPLRATISQAPASAAAVRAKAGDFERGFDIPTTVEKRGMFGGKRKKPLTQAEGLEMVEGDWMRQARAEDLAAQGYGPSQSTRVAASSSRPIKMEQSPQLSDAVRSAGPSMNQVRSVKDEGQMLAAAVAQDVRTQMQGAALLSQDMASNPALVGTPAAELSQQVVSQTQLRDAAAMPATRVVANATSVAPVAGGGMGDSNPVGTNSVTPARKLNFGVDKRKAPFDATLSVEGPSQRPRLDSPLPLSAFDAERVAGGVYTAGEAEPLHRAYAQGILTESDLRLVLAGPFSPGPQIGAVNADGTARRIEGQQGGATVEPSPIRAAAAEADSAAQAFLGQQPVMSPEQSRQLMQALRRSQRVSKPVQRFGFGDI